MKLPLKRVLAGLVAAGAVWSAHAQEPVASVSRSGATVDAIAQALSADPSLKGSKITVQPDESGVVYLTGVTPTWQQMRHAGSIAAQHAGEGKVANAITTEQIFIDLARPEESEPLPEEGGEAPKAEGAVPAA